MMIDPLLRDPLRVIQDIAIGAKGSPRSREAVRQAKTRSQSPN